MVYDVTEKVSEIMNRVQKYSKDYCDFKNIIVNEDMLELAGDSIKILSLLNNSRKIYCLSKFKKFLDGFNINSSKDEIQKLIDYVDNDEKAEFITNTFDKIISANSKIACSIMGALVNQMVRDKRNVGQSDLMLVQALELMNDFDVKNFVHLISIEDWKDGSKYKSINKKMKMKLKDKYYVSMFDLELSLQVMERGGLVEKEGSVDVDIDSDNPEFSSADYDETVYFNLLSKKLYVLAEKVVSQIDNMDTLIQ